MSDQVTPRVGDGPEVLYIIRTLPFFENLDVYKLRTEIPKFTSMLELRL